MPDRLDDLLQKQEAKWKREENEPEMQEQEECDHKGHYKVTGSGFLAIRYCVSCGTSWRMRDEGSILAWELVKEPVEK